MSIDFSGKTAIVTGSGQGLGRAYALELAGRGAKVVINDLGTSLSGEGRQKNTADEVVKLIRSRGGEALASYINVADYEQVEAMVQQALDTWGQVDILVNNAGVLRDKSFAKMPLDDIRLVTEVHLMGSINCCKAIWNHMRERNYGRIVNVSSSTGLYGNFGQANYGAAKLALVGLMNTLRIEGAKNNIRVNCIVPVAVTRMTEAFYDEDTTRLLTPEAVAAGVAFLVSDNAPSGAILSAAGGAFSCVTIGESAGIKLTSNDPDELASRWDEIAESNNIKPLSDASAHALKFVDLASSENKS